MHLFTITSEVLPEALLESAADSLCSAFRSLHKDAERITVQFQASSVSKQARSSIHCEVELHGMKKVQEFVGQLYRASAETMAEWMLLHHEADLIRELLEKEFGYSEEAEVSSILKYSCLLLNDQQDELYPGESRSRRKQMIVEALQPFMEEQSLLIPEGFMRFRLSKYKDELREVIEFAIDEYLMEKQYQDFISLLQYFVYIQEAKIPAAHLIHKGQNEFELLNEDMIPLESPQWDGFVVDMIDRQFNYEDMIVSTLITVSPAKVYIHTRFPEEQVIKTISQIFESRATICTTCAHCSPFLDDQKKKGKLFP